MLHPCKLSNNHEHSQFWKYLTGSLLSYSNESLKCFPCLNMWPQSIKVNGFVCWDDISLTDMCPSWTRGIVAENTHHYYLCDCVQISEPDKVRDSSQSVCRIIAFLVRVTTSHESTRVELEQVRRVIILLWQLCHSFKESAYMYSLRNGLVLNFMQFCPAERIA